MSILRFYNLICGISMEWEIARSTQLFTCHCLHKTRFLSYANRQDSAREHRQAACRRRDRCAAHARRKLARRRQRAASRERIAALLADLRAAALGRRRLLWPRPRGVQWNPTDDLCLAVELRIERGERRELSRRLIEIKSRRAVAR
jgi:hypothetical protein